MMEMEIVDALSVLKFEWQKSREFLGLAAETAAVLKTLRNLRS